jgi:hypothetical protein
MKVARTSYQKDSIPSTPRSEKQQTSGFLDARLPDQSPSTLMNTLLGAVSQIVEEAGDAAEQLISPPIASRATSKNLIKLLEEKHDQERRSNLVKIKHGISEAIVRIKAGEPANKPLDFDKPGHDFPEIRAESTMIPVSFSENIREVRNVIHKMEKAIRNFAMTEHDELAPVPEDMDEPETQSQKIMVDLMRSEHIFQRWNPPKRESNLDALNKGKEAKRLIENIDKQLAKIPVKIAGDTLAEAQSSAVYIPPKSKLKVLAEIVSTQQADSLSSSRLSTPSSRINGEHPGINKQVVSSFDRRVSYSASRLSASDHDAPLDETALLEHPQGERIHKGPSVIPSPRAFPPPQMSTTLLFSKESSTASTPQPLPAPDIKNNENYGETSWQGRIRITNIVDSEKSVVEAQGNEGTDGITGSKQKRWNPPMITRSPGETEVSRFNCMNQPTSFASGIAISKMAGINDEGLVSSAADSSFSVLEIAHRAIDDEPVSQPGINTLHTGELDDFQLNEGSAGPSMSSVEAAMGPTEGPAESVPSPVTPGRRAHRRIGNYTLREGSAGPSMSSVEAAMGPTEGPAESVPSPVTPGRRAHRRIGNYTLRLSSPVKTIPPKLLPKSPSPKSRR